MRRFIFLSLIASTAAALCISAWAASGADTENSTTSKTTTIIHFEDQQLDPAKKDIKIIQNRLKGLRRCILSYTNLSSLLVNAMDGSPLNPSKEAFAEEVKIAERGIQMNDGVSQENKDRLLAVFKAIEQRYGQLYTSLFSDMDGIIRETQQIAKSNPSSAEHDSKASYKNVLTSQGAIIAQIQCSDKNCEKMVNLLNQTEKIKRPFDLLTIQTMFLEDLADSNNAVLWLGFLFPNLTITAKGSVLSCPQQWRQLLEVYAREGSKIQSATAQKLEHDVLSVIVEQKKIESFSCEACIPYHIIKTQDCSVDSHWYSRGQETVPLSQVLKSSHSTKPVLQTVSLFTQADVDLFQNINKTLFVDKTFGNDEAIMNLGRALNSDIAKKLGALLKNQFERRGINLELDREKLLKWLHTKTVDTRKEDVQEALVYIEAAAKGGSRWTVSSDGRYSLESRFGAISFRNEADAWNDYQQHFTFLHNSLYEVKALYEAYHQKWGELLGVPAVRDALEALIYQATGALMDQKHKCHTGAQARNGLLRFGMLNFLMDHHREWTIPI